MVYLLNYGWVALMVSDPSFSTSVDKSRVSHRNNVSPHQVVDKSGNYPSPDYEDRDEKKKI